MRRPAGESSSTTPDDLRRALVVGSPALLVVPGTTPVQTWPDPSGRLCAMAYATPEGYLVVWPGLARFTFSPSGGDTWATPVPGVDERDVRDAYERFVVPLVWQSRGGEALHASALRWPTGVVLFCAASGTGKSTLAYALARRSHPVLTDDGVLLDTKQEPATARAVRGGIRLRGPSARFFGLPDPPPGGRVEVEWPDTAQLDVAEPVRAVFTLSRVPPERGAPHARRVEAAEALTLVLAHAHCLDPTSTVGRGRTVENYMSLLAAAPAWVVTYPTGFAQLEATADLIEQVAVGLE